MIAAAATVRPPGTGECLRRAFRDFYEESWRLVVLNALLSAYVLLVLSVGLYVPLALVLLLGAGPLAAGLVAAAVAIVEEGSLTFAEAAEAYRRSWRRGVALAVLVAAAAAATGFAAGFYGAGGALTWPLAVLVVYLGLIFALWQLLLWPLALRDVERPLREVAREAGVLLVRRPGATTGLGVALLLVNLVGVTLAVLPFLTMTIAYSALAAARFALSSAVPEEG